MMVASRGSVSSFGENEDTDSSETTEQAHLLLIGESFVKDDESKDSSGYWY